MPVTVRQKIVPTQVWEGPITVTTGAGTLATDLLVAIAGGEHARETNLGTPTNGPWTAHASRRHWIKAPRVRAWSRKAGAAGSQSYTFPYTGSRFHWVNFYVLAGAQAVGASATRGGFFALTQLSPSVDAVDVDEFLICGMQDIAGLTTATSQLTKTGPTGQCTRSGGVAAYAGIALTVRTTSGLNVSGEQIIRHGEVLEGVPQLGNTQLVVGEQIVRVSQLPEGREYGELAAEALAAAVEDDERAFGVLFEVDWAGDGLYAHAASNVSVLVDKVTLAVSLTGALPEDITLIEGYVAAKVTASLSGRDHDGTITGAGDMDAAQLLSPFNRNSPLWGAKRDGVACRYSVVVDTDVGPQTVRQYTGKVRTISVSSKARTAALVCSDWVEDMRFPIDLPLHGSNQVGTFRPTWAMDWVLRRGGLYASPPARSDAIFSATMHGAIWPEVGWYDDEAATAVSLTASPTWIAGVYSWAINCSPTSRHYQHYWTSVGFAPRANTSVAIGYWIYWSNTAGFSQLALFIDPGENANRYVDLWIDSPGVLNSRVKIDAFDVTKNGPTITTPGWHYIGVHFRFTSTGTFWTFNLDGTLSAEQSAGAAGLAVTVPSRNQVRWEARHPMNCLQIWLPATTDKTFPKDPAQVSTALELTGQLLFAMPDRKGVNAMTVLAEITAADLGMIGADENGLVRFRHRAMLEADEQTVEWEIDASTILDFATVDSLDQVRNVIQGSASPSTVYRDDIVFNASRRDQFRTNGTTTATYVVDIAADGAGWVKEGNVPYTPGFVHDLKVYNPTKHGFKVCTTADPPADVTTNVTVTVKRLSYRALTLTVVNNNAFAVDFADSANGAQPALRVGGSRIHFYKREDFANPAAAMDYSYSDQDSIDDYDMERAYTIPTSPWRSWLSSTEQLAFSLLKDTARAVPVVQAFSTVGDPRRKLGDTVAIVDPDGIVDRVVGVIVGVTREQTVGGKLTDRLQVQLLAPAADPTS